MSRSNLVEAFATMKFTNAMPLWLTVAILSLFSPSESKVVETLPSRFGEMIRE